MAQLAVQDVTRTGLSPAYAAASAGGDTVIPGQDTFIHVKNGGAGATNVTVNSRQLCNQGFDHDLVVAVPAGGERMIGPITDRFKDTDGLADITYDVVTTVTIAALKIAS